MVFLLRLGYGLGFWVRARVQELMLGVRVTILVMFTVAKGYNHDVWLGFGFDLC